ncbi:hypothetical protein BDN72DRAFT_760582 [Pluteus cervinus]|uniref:Uncharacterized protein n=1 Tax=Pluteus cervinus TaxID=181527 RepID=A0ACD3B7Y3_9AGAR|nr:hypothetical protein BDN72DRAFT_760582 [Pluteus cervinus]
MPIRRPRKPKSTGAALGALHDKYHNDGRILKYSGDARFWSTYPVTNKEYRPLPDPPSPTSPYHIHGGLIARLELLDALICFTYAIWCRDQSRGACIQETWKTTGPFLDWCKQKWTAEEGDDHEKAFIGLIWMMEGFIQARLEAYSCNGIATSLDELQHSAKSQALSAAEKAEQSGPTASGSRTQGTPPMLPSPASLGAPGSANSTPTNTGATSGARPATAANSRPPQTDSELPVPRHLLPPQYKDVAVPSHVLDAMSAVTVPVKISFLHHVRQQHTKTASKCLTESQNFLTLPIMARSFPLTFNRMVYSTLSAAEEHVPDMEDEAGELFWPGQCITGEGLGWVCLMGKAMINEFGKKYSYQGVKGAVKKPQIDSGLDAQHPHRQGHPLPRRPADANRG